jgi:putative transposase
MPQRILGSPIAPVLVEFSIPWRWDYNTVRPLSLLNWLHLLQDLKARGLQEHALVAVADGALGFWKALEEAFPGARAQQCWVKKTANVLDKLSQRVRPDAKRLLHEMYLADTKKEALAAYQDKYPKACDCLKKDRDVMFTFYDFPAAH